MISGMRSLSVLTRGLFYLAAIAVIAGCGGGGSTIPPPVRAVTFGTVKYDGKPIANGKISFVPESGPAAMAPIKDGAYRIDLKGGVPVGKSRVEVESIVETGKDITIGAGGKTEKETMQLIPPKYNHQSELKAVIEADKENEHNFDLQK